MSFVYNKLSGRIKECYGTQENFSIAMGLSRASLSKRLNNRMEFSQKEIQLACELLSIKKEEIPAYFFTVMVQKTKPPERSAT